jgi:hypothetical protein
VRRFQADEIPAEWFGGNLKVETLRKIATCIDRVSKSDEVDVWEYKDGYESHVREWLNRLREGFLSLRQIETLIQHRRKTLAAERKTQKYAGMSPEAIATLEANEGRKSQERKLNELRQGEKITFTISGAAV